MTKFVEVKTQDLTGAALDWSVAKAEKVEGLVTHKGHPSFEKEFDPDCWADHSCLKEFKCWQYYAPSAEWSQGGPLIEKYKLDIGAPLENKNGPWNAATEWAHPMGYKGETPLIAACRAIVASVLGGTVSVPKELLS
ncbi:hypothetical protein A7J50_3790 [Pseudomonas antarctica]|uniref:DUF2591 domain-containing protein n=1 Tax=Pseudomonas antarctica TaxID=219572 RepID=A0A172Z3M2_9PSED|nr:phage protein NinX family protein [Pseudomonas antarctica]ANF87163.1 hypothetical protein A7J50_3790 [Pseudomonas antarctica]